MSEWKEVILAEITEKIGDGLHGTPKYDDNGDYYFINGNNLNEGKIIIKQETKKVSKAEFDKYQKPLSEKTIFLGINGTIGNLAFYNGEKCVLGKSACYINVNDKVNKYFLYYNFLNRDFQNFLEGIATGTTIPNVPLKGLRDYSFKLPSLPEQTAIAEVLSSLDDKIDLLHRQNKTLEQLAETLFRQWFVEEAEESWEEKTIRDIGDHSKESINPSKYPDKVFYHYSLPAYDDGKNPKAEIGKDILSNKYKVVPNSILISKLNPRFPRIWELYGEAIPENAICSTEFQIVKPKEEAFFGFIFCFLKSYQVTQELANASGGTSGSHQRVNPDDIFNLSFLMPPKKLIEKFHLFSKEHLQKVKSNTQQIRTLTQLRDTLLPKLMSGEVRVNN
jgi:type I restriction enzyme S subunit